MAGLGVASTAQAGLINRGNGMIYDTDRNITWLADANYAMTSGYNADGLMTWSAANAWAASLTIGGFTNWRLPATLQPDATCSVQSGGASYGNNCTGSELGHLFYQELGGVAGSSILTTHNANVNLFSNIGNFSASDYWSSTDYASALDNAWSFRYINNSQNFLTKTYSLGGWAVRTGDIAAVPEPGMIWLLLAGGLGWVGTQARRRG